MIKKISLFACMYLYAMSSQAEIVTYRVTGVVDSVSRSGVSPEGTFQAGDSLESFIAFDTSIPDFYPDDPNYGDYREIVTNATATVGNACWEWDNSPLNGRTRINLEDAQGTEFIDTVIHEETGLRTFYLVLAFFNDPDQDNLDSDAFSFDPSGFEAVHIDLFDFQYRDSSRSNYDWYLHAELSNISVNPIPISAAVWLFGSGLIGLIGLARRRAE